MILASKLFKDFFFKPNIGITKTQQKLHILCKVNSSDAAVPFGGGHTKTAHTKSTPEDGMWLPSGKGIKNGPMCSTAPKKLVHYLHQKRNAEEESTACGLFKVWPSSGQKGGKQGKQRVTGQGRLSQRKICTHIHYGWATYSLLSSTPPWNLQPLVLVIFSLSKICQLIGVAHHLSMWSGKFGTFNSPTSKHTTKPSNFKTTMDKTDTFWHHWKLTPFW